MRSCTISGTDATVDLCRIANQQPIGIICEILNEDGSMARGDQIFNIAKNYNLKVGTIAELASYLENNPEWVRRLEEPRFVMESFVNFPCQYGDFQLAHFRNFKTQEDLTIICKGEFTQALQDEKTLVRLHSECLTGDVFRSFRCDCGDQLQFALEEIEKRGRGLIFYLRQEGRGIGLSNKLKAYALQDQGHDTVEANLILGLPADARVYDQVQDVLNFFYVKNVDLMTNNPKKIQALKEMGFGVERFPVQSRVRKQNLNYLSTKVKKMGHDIDLTKKD